MILRAYQERAVNETAQKLADGVRKLVLQLATGGGKTIIFSAISKRYTDKSSKAVLILVHRKELLQQTRRTLYEAFGITAQVIQAGMRFVPSAPVYVGMVESTKRRIPANVGLVIIDEAHICSFNKIHEQFPTQFIIGFTATPISANKRIPMKDFYEDIVCGIDIPDLIASGNLCQNITFAPKDVVDRSSLAVKGGEFEEGLMASQFSKPRYVANTVKAYQRWSNGSKCIVFNVNIEHSRAVHEAFLLAGLESRHLDSTMTATERSHILRWFATTPNAVLNNVGILTAGFDEPSIETVIMNRCTLSMPLWLQCTGRGARPTPSKSAFTIIDMGGNAVTHGDWCQSREWDKLFLNPPKPGENGVAPVKNCPQCDGIIPAGRRVCNIETPSGEICGYEFPAKEAVLEEELSEFVIVTKGIDVQAVIAANKEKKEYYPFFKIGKDIAIQAKKSAPRMDQDVFEFILDRYFMLAKEWCHQKGKRFNRWHQDTARTHLTTELQERFKNWKPTSLTLEPVTI